MKSKDLIYAIRVGEIVIDDKIVSSKEHVYYKNRLKIILDSHYHEIANATCVYYFLVNDEVVKIGQSSAKGGFEKGCLSFYLNAGTDDSGQNRFAINYLMRKELNLGNMVEVFVQFYTFDNNMYKIDGINQKHEIPLKFDGKDCENACMEDYLKFHNNQYPIWNFQESNTELPQQIVQAHAYYRNVRSQKKVDKTT